MKKLLKCHEIMIVQQKTYYIICTSIFIIKSLAYIYQDKQIRLFLKKFTSQENYKKMMVRQCFILLKSSKKLF